MAIAWTSRRPVSVRVRRASACSSKAKSGRMAFCGLAPLGGMMLAKGEKKRKGVSGRERLKEGMSCALLECERKAELVKHWGPVMDRFSFSYLISD